jgi:CheY-like chemotaxis protein
MKFLIVEDNHTTALLLAQIIEKLGAFEAHSRDTAGSALKLAASMPFDIIIVDYMLPDFDGIRLSRELRALPGYEHVPILMITSSYEKNVRRAALEAGITEFVNKPIDVVELKVRIGGMVWLREARGGALAGCDELIARLGLIGGLPEDDLALFREALLHVVAPIQPIEVLDDPLRDGFLAEFNTFAARVADLARAHANRSAPYNKPDDLGAVSLPASSGDLRLQRASGDPTG